MDWPTSESMTRPWRSDPVARSISWMTSCEWRLAALSPQTRLHPSAGNSQVSGTWQISSWVFRPLWEAYAHHRPWWGRHHAPQLDAPQRDKGSGFGYFRGRYTARYPVLSNLRLGRHACFHPFEPGHYRCPKVLDVGSWRPNGDAHSGKRRYVP